MNHSKKFIKTVLSLLLLTLLISACVQIKQPYEAWKAATPQSYSLSIATPEPISNQEDGTGILSTAEPQLTLTLAAVQATPTEAPWVDSAPLRDTSIVYTIQEGEYLAAIANAHQVSVNQILSYNPGINANLLYPGQTITIPPDSINELATTYKIIPDTELVYGPSLKEFDTLDIVKQFNGALHTYHETFYNGRRLSGAEIVQLVADENGVNPRLLLAILEYHGGWLTLKEVSKEVMDYPIGYQDYKFEGLYDYLNWAADRLIAGYTAYPKGYMKVYTLLDEKVYRVSPNINAGTAAVQHFYARFMGTAQWNKAISEGGLVATYRSLFGDPFAFGAQVGLPADLEQPEFILPMAYGDVWLFTSGPHYGWGLGSPWAALDFAPPGDEEDYGCYESFAPVLAVADGIVTRSTVGSVVIDLDGDGFEQTGWTVHYVHIGSINRVKVGTHVAAGDAIGYASCEGGYTTGTHFHIARRYNGIWVDAYGDTPFNLGGWVAYSTGTAYNGYLMKNGKRIEAFNGRSHVNEIFR